MKANINPLITVLRKLNLVSRFLNSFPVPDFNVKGCFYEKEFIDHIEPHIPDIPAPSDIESQPWCEPSIGNVSFI